MTSMLTLRDEPTKICQNNFDPGRGNALQAAVASMFGCELEDVPNFIEMPEGYEKAIQNFCRLGEIDCQKVPVSAGIHTLTEYEQYLGKLCLLRGTSPRGNFGHVVVARFTAERFEMVHDPHPDGTMLDTNQGFGWCMFFGKSKI